MDMAFVSELPNWLWVFLSCLVAAFIIGFVFFRYVWPPTLTYITDYLRSKETSYGITTRSDGRGGYFWGNNSQSKDAIKSLAEQIEAQQKGLIKPARFGGIYVKDMAVYRVVYETLSHAGFPMVMEATLPGGMKTTIIDAP